MKPTETRPTVLESPVRLLVKLSLPVMGEELVNLLVGWTDWWLAGRFLAGDAPKAAMGLMAYAMWLLPSLFAAIAIGATAICARETGAGNTATARHAGNQSLVMGLVFALVATALVWFGAERFVALSGLQGESAQLAVRYLRIVAPALPFIMVEQVAAAILRGMGDTYSGFVAKTSVNVVDIVVSAGLVAGWGPFPKLGWDGLAIGSACGHTVGGTILLAMLLRGRSGMRITRGDLAPDVSLMRRILRVGVPGGVDALSVIFCHLAYASVINRLGTPSAAAHGLGLQIEAMSYLPGSAFQAAATTMAGQYLGARDVARVRRAVGWSCACAMLVMIVAGTVLFLFGHPIAVFFNGMRSDATTTLAGKLLKIVALSCPFLAVLMVLTGALRGVGDTRWPLLITLTGLLGVRLPLAIVLAWSAAEGPWLSDHGVPLWGLGVTGAWIAMVIDVVLRGMAVSWRFIRGDWHKTVV